MSQPDFPNYKLSSDLRMTAKKVVELYELLKNNGVEIWIDGGWGVDALLGEQTREHADLDIALDYKDEADMQKILAGLGYSVTQTNDKSQWVYVMSDGQHLVDVHVFKFENGQNVYNTKYVPDAMSGTGIIDGRAVRTIEPGWMVQYHTRYKLADKDRHDVALLCEKYGIPLPEVHINT